jgi:hypothetical protein
LATKSDISSPGTVDGPEPRTAEEREADCIVGEAARRRLAATRTRIEKNEPIGIEAPDEMRSAQNRTMRAKWMPAEFERHRAKLAQIDEPTVLRFSSRVRGLRRA